MNLRLAVSKISGGGRPWNGGPVTVVVKTLLTPTLLEETSVSTLGPLPAPAGPGNGGRGSVVSVAAVVPTTSAPRATAMRTGGRLLHPARDVREAAAAELPRDPGHRVQPVRRGDAHQDPLVRRPPRNQQPAAAPHP